MKRLLQYEIIHFYSKTARKWVELAKQAQHLVFFLFQWNTNRIYFWAPFPTILVPKHHRIVSQNIPWMSEYFISLTKHVINVSGPWDISVNLVNTFFQKFESVIDLVRCLVDDVDDEQPYAKISSLFLQPKVFSGAFTSITNERCFFTFIYLDSGSICFVTARITAFSTWTIGKWEMWNFGSLKRMPGSDQHPESGLVYRIDKISTSMTNRNCFA